MPRPTTARRRRVPPVAAAILHAVTARLSRIEALLVEMRYEQDVKLKRINGLQVQLDALTEQVQVMSAAVRRRAVRRK